MLAPVTIRTCRQCSKPFTPWSTTQAVCSRRCATTEQTARRKADAARERAEFKARKLAMKTLPQLAREAQVIFNKWVRARDEQKPCISCGKPPGDMSQLHAGRDAGHYRSVGSASHLRFNEANCHAQCVKCNQWGAGMAVDYRIRLIERIGLRAVEHLETSNDPRKWTREELIAIKSMYAAKLKALRQSK